MQAQIREQMSSGNKYIISGGIEGKKRLDILADVLKSYTIPLLVANGLKEGVSFLDAGCGGGSVTKIAATATGPAGRVVGIDFDEEIIKIARKEAGQLGLDNIEYLTQSAYDIDYSNEFNVVYSRFLLSHLTEPQLVLNKMVKSTKPGGSVIVEDIQFSGHFCHPANWAFNNYVDLFTAAATRRGQNANIGPYLINMFKTAGLTNVQFDIIQPVFSKGSGKRMAFITMEKIKDAVVSESLANEAFLAELLIELDNFTTDESTLMSLPRIFRVWAKKT